MWNWPETLVVDDCWRAILSETLLVDTTPGLEDEIHLVMSEHLIVKVEEILKYTVTKAKNELRSLTIAIGEQTSEESTVQFELLLRYNRTTGPTTRVLFEVTNFLTVIYSLKKETNVFN